MKLKYILSCLVISIFVIWFFFLGEWNYGYVKSYSYSCKKDVLQKAIMTVIKNNPNIYRDTSLDYLGSSPALDSLNVSGKDFAAGDNFYNDIKHNVTIKITSGKEINEYIFSYLGPSEDWKTTESSQISICYAYDKNGKGGGLHNSGLNWRTGKLKKKLIDVFEVGFIQKVDSVLNIVHTEPD